MRIKFITHDDMPEKKLADAEVIFDDGELAGMKLVGFTVWRGDSGGFVTFPARAYGKGKDREYFNFLRATGDDAKPVFRLKDAIMKAWRQAQREQTVTHRLAKRESK